MDGASDGARNNDLLGPSHASLFQAMIKMLVSEKQILAIENPGGDTDSA
jgi:hypothetical protein